MADLWIPPSARTFDPDIEATIAGSDDPVAARQAAADLEDAGITFPSDDDFGATVGPDSMVILMPQDWLNVTKTDGQKVMAALVKSKPLERMLMDATIEVERSGVLVDTEFTDPTRGQTLVAMGIYPALHMALKQFNIAVPLESPKCPCPIDWRTSVAAGFAIAVAHPDPTEERVLYVASPPLTMAPMIVNQADRPSKVGRNERCPCGSGLKFKRCCGR